MNKIAIYCDKELHDYFTSKVKYNEIVILKDTFDFEEDEKILFETTKVYIQPSIVNNDELSKVVTLKENGIEVIMLPTIEELLGSNSYKKIDEINFFDVFGYTNPNTDISHNYIENTSVLITGAAGSIGSVLTKEIAKLKPKKIIMLDINESALYFLELQLKNNTNIDIEVVICNIQDDEKVSKIFIEENIDYVFHAAAHKHVPMMERNPQEAIKNNILGTYNVAKTAADNNVKKFILVSTDKAVNPTNIMGASKRFAEYIISSIDSKNTIFAAVRFGNVFGSVGSLLPIFQNQLKAQKNLTVTDKDTTRFFMSIEDAAKLVIIAGDLAQKNEVFILEMGEAKKIVDVAQRIIDITGINVGIDFIGLRPGEKKYEELLYDINQVEKTPNKSIFIAKNDYVCLENIEDLIKVAKIIANENNRVATYDFFKQNVPTYKKADHD